MTTPASPSDSSVFYEGLPPFAAAGQPLDEVDTPSLVLDLDAFEANLRTMQDWADRHGVALRPHAKAHKCPEVARRQMALGAAGICCQKVSEAVPFVAAGITDVLISNEVVGARKLALLARLAQRATIAVCVDDAGNLADISRAMSAAGAQVGVLVEVDAGQGRCGVPDTASAVALARQAQALPGVVFAGLQAYHGGVQHLRTREERALACQIAAGRAAAFRDAVRAAGIPCDRVTGAGTGSAEFDAAGGVYTELQPGSYAFMDTDYGRNDWSDTLRFQHALHLLATVMSTPAPGRAVLDAGLKSMTTESGLPWVAGADGVRHAGVSCRAVNDEHAILDVPSGATLRLGEKIGLVPAHVDPAFNLHDQMAVYRNGVVEGVWDISARGCSR